MKYVRIALWVAAAMAALTLGLLSLRPVPKAGLPASAEMEVAAIGGPFTLVDSTGKPFSSQKLAGRPHVVFFGFTHCPDVCPTTLVRLAKLRRQIGKGDDAFDIVFITVDPERDGPAEVGAYATLFDTPVIGLTGSPAQIERVKKQYAVFSQKVPQDEGGYAVDHTASIFVMGRDGRFVSTIAPEEGDGPALAKLKRIIG